LVIINRAECVGCVDVVVSFLFVNNNN